MYFATLCNPSGQYIHHAIKFCLLFFQVFQTIWCFRKSNESLKLKFRITQDIKPRHQTQENQWKWILKGKRRFIGMQTPKTQEKGMNAGEKFTFFKLFNN